MPLFVHEAKFDANKQQIWDWYNSDGAFRRIMPEWEGIQPINAGRLVDGEETIFKVKMGPIRQKWVARVRFANFEMQKVVTRGRG